MDATGKEAPSVLSWDVVHSTRFLRLCSLTYRDRTGRTRKYEAAMRATKALPSAESPAFSADAVALVAILRSKTSAPKLLLVKQFRPPVSCDTLELVAGLIDPGETPAQAAARELKEETGYVVQESSMRVRGPLCLSPGLSNESFMLVHVDIDLDAPENQNPKQDEADKPHIKVLAVPLDSLQDMVTQHIEGGGIVWGGIQTLLVGMGMKSPKLAPPEGNSSWLFIAGLMTSALAVAMIRLWH
mmetsp:Transcript_22971/g.42623  ORF Transcript_22971/g.42623 Transcript_22971/m.42623 type:complete len:243 (+) Transcript_22971:53-781(+)